VEIVSFESIAKPKYSKKHLESLAFCMAVKYLYDRGYGRDATSIILETKTKYIDQVYKVYQFNRTYKESRKVASQFRQPWNSPGGYNVIREEIKKLFPTAYGLS